MSDFKQKIMSPQSAMRGQYEYYFKVDSSKMTATDARIIIADDPDIDDATIQKVHSEDDEKDEVKEDDGELGEEINDKITAKFILFSKLPVELRFEIWSIHIAMSGRLVEPYWKRHRVSHRVVPRWSARTPIPSILHVCRESRREGLKKYKLMSPVMPKNLSHHSFKSTIYYNGDVDTLYFRTDLPYCDMFDKDMETIKSLAIPVEMFQQGYYKELSSPIFQAKLHTGETRNQELGYAFFSVLSRKFPRLERLDLILEFGKIGKKKLVLLKNTEQKRLRNAIDIQCNFKKRWLEATKQIGGPRGEWTPKTRMVEMYPPLLRKRLLKSDMSSSKSKAPK